MSSSSSRSDEDGGLRALVVDDEPLACRNLRRKLLAAGGVTEVEVATDPVEAVTRLRTVPVPDLVFLDVRMPGLSGLELLAHFPERDRAFSVVFCTAHDEYAASAFEAAALDYLVKPVDPARLAVTLARVRRRRAASAERGSAPGDQREDVERARAAGIGGWLERVLVRYRGSVQVLSLAEVLVLSSEAHRAVAYTADEEFVLEPSLAAIEPQLDPMRFVRCHRAHIVQLRHVTAVETDEVVLIGGSKVALSRRCRGGVLAALERDATVRAAR